MALEAFTAVRTANQYLRIVTEIVWRDPSRLAVERQDRLRHMQELSEAMDAADAAVVSVSSWLPTLGTELRQHLHSVYTAAGQSLDAAEAALGGSTSQERDVGAPDESLMKAVVDVQKLLGEELRNLLHGPTSRTA